MDSEIPCKTCLVLPSCMSRLCKDNYFLMTDLFIRYMKNIECETVVKFIGYREIPPGDYREFYYDRVVAILEFFQDKIDLKSKKHKGNY